MKTWRCPACGGRDSSGHPCCDAPRCETCGVAVSEGGRLGTNGKPPACKRCLGTELRREAGIAPRAPASRNGLRIRLRESQTRDVERAAKQMGLTVQDLVRGCVDRFLTIRSEKSQSPRRTRGAAP